MPEGLKAVDTALDRVASRMTPVIRNRAIDAGWPEEVASRISMVRTANGLGVHVDPSVARIAEDLEFGSMSNAPQSVLSTFNSPQMKKQIERTAHNSMDELLDRMRGLFA
jgi:hypothetical protein